MFADVSLPVAVNKEFTYIVPEELKAAARIGVRVIVPFGRKYATGLIVALPASCSLPSLKPLKDVIDASTVVPEELLKLCRWVAEYYFAPLGEVLKAALPHGFASTRRRLVAPSASLGKSTVDSVARGTSKRAKLLQTLLDRGPMLSTDLQKRTGIRTIHAVLNELEREGLIATEEVLPSGPRKARTLTYALLSTADAQKASEYLVTLPARKRKIRDLIQGIMDLKASGVAEMPVRDLIKKTKVSSKAVKELTLARILTVAQREVRAPQEFGIDEETLSIRLNAAQRRILARLAGAIDSGTHRTFLLHGVTGSGKTQVYIEAIRHCLERGKSAIVLVPEISLTPQIVRRFRSHFGDLVAVVHSRMSSRDRQDVWQRVNHHECRVVIGPRSAVFAPFDDVGLIVVDEEHESSYKQFDASPRYHARDTAIVRAANVNATIVLGSATPSIESYQNAKSGKYELLEMPARVRDVTLPEIRIVDMIGERKRVYSELRESLPQGKRSALKSFQQPSLSRILQEKIADRLARKEGIILLQNRRGFSPFVECMDCGYIEMCENCNVTLTYHLAQRHLRCHYCGLLRAPHAQCPQCQGPNLKLQGIGTQRVEQELTALFPSASVLRMDLDTTTRRGSHDRLLRKFADGSADILLGTQMVAKGLDFPRVTLVGVVSADTQMLLPDFRSSERTFQLLTQVAGRAGRSDLKGEVIIQTHQPKHYTLAHVVDHEFRAFFDVELESRRELNYPPFSRIVLIELKGPDDDAVRTESERFARTFAGKDGGWSMLGPAPAVISKINNQYRWHIVVKDAKSRDPSGSHLRGALKETLKSFEVKRKHNVRVIVDVDPVGLM